MTSYEYVPGDAPEEADRLRRQAELWDPETLRLLDLADVGRGARVLEIGPGAGSIHAELRRRVNGPVDAVERSEVFARTLETAAEGDGLGAGKLWRCDLLDADVPLAAYDVIFARWVFCFLPSPDRHIELLASALKPGGRLVIQDYVHRDAFALWPRPAQWFDLLAADRALFESEGGDPSIGRRLPAFFEGAGLSLRETHVVQKHGAPGSDVWNWLWDFFLSVRGRLGRTPPLTAENVRALEEAWAAAADDPGSVVIAPTVIGFVAQAPRGRAASAEG